MVASCRQGHCLFLSTGLVLILLKTCICQDIAPLTDQGSLGNLAPGSDQSSLEAPAAVTIQNADCQIVDVSAGGFHTCAILMSKDGDKGLKCWGTNEYGQLGLGSVRAYGNESKTMADALPFVNLGKGVTPIQVAAGIFFTCALTAPFNKVKCWGDNAFGQLGLNDTMKRGNTSGTMGDALPYVEMPAGEVVAQIATGDYHACALTKSGKVFCWGNNWGAGVLGVDSSINAVGAEPDSMGNKLTPVNFGGNFKAIAVACGVDYTCAMLTSATGNASDTSSAANIIPAVLKCWGRNKAGGLGQNGPEIQQSLGGSNDTRGDGMPVVNLGTGAVPAVVMAGREKGQTCVVLRDQRLKCFGANDMGQLGLGDTSNRGTIPDQMGDRLPAVFLGNNTRPVSVGGGAGHTCALYRDSTNKTQVKCWGNNRQNQYFGSPVGQMQGQMEKLQPLNLGTNLADAVQIVVGGFHTCVRFADGGLKCFGGVTAAALGYETSRIFGSTAGTVGDALPYVDVCGSWPTTPATTPSPAPKSPSQKGKVNNDTAGITPPVSPSQVEGPGLGTDVNPDQGNDAKKKRVVAAVVSSVVCVAVLCAAALVFIVIRKRQQQQQLEGLLPSTGGGENEKGMSPHLPGNHGTTSRGNRNGYPAMMVAIPGSDTTYVTSSSTDVSSTRIMSAETTVLDNTSGSDATSHHKVALLQSPGGRHGRFNSSPSSRSAASSIISPKGSTMLAQLASGYTTTSSSEDLMLKWSDLKMGKKIGTGGFGEVWRATWQGHPVAVKMMLNCSPKELQDLRHEADIMSKCYNPNIARVYGIADDGQQRVALVMQYYRGGSLSSLIADVKYEEVDILARLDIALQVARGMRYMHERPRPILHLDLKTSNILLEESASKWVHLDRPRLIACIADFGLSGKTTESGGVEAAASTPSITPPEVFLNKNAPRMPSADVYAFGIVLLEILTGLKAWGNLNVTQLKAAAVAGNRPPIPFNIPTELADLIKACWAHDPASRPAFGDVAQKLEVAARGCVVSHGTAGRFSVNQQEGDTTNMLTGTTIMH